MIPSSHPGWGDTLPTGAPRSLLARPTEGGDSLSTWHRAQGSGLGVPAWVGEGGNASGNVAQTQARGSHFWGRPPKRHTRGASETTDLSSHSPGEQPSGNEVLTGRQCLPELQGRVPPCHFRRLVAPAILWDRGGGRTSGPDGAGARDLPSTRGSRAARSGLAVLILLRPCPGTHQFSEGRRVGSPCQSGICRDTAGRGWNDPRGDRHDELMFSLI